VCVKSPVFVSLFWINHQFTWWLTTILCQMWLFLTTISFIFLHPPSEIAEPSHMDAKVHLQEIRLGKNSSRRVRNQNGGIFCLYLKNPIDTIWMRDEHTWFGFSHLEKYESQWEGWSHILWKKMFQTANQIHLPAILGLGTFVFWHIAMERKNQTGPTGHQSGGRWTSGNCTLKIYWFTEYLLSMV